MKLRNPASKRQGRPNITSRPILNNLWVFLGVGLSQKRPMLDFFSPHLVSHFVFGFFVIVIVVANPDSLLYFLVTGKL